jgi:hypothetical protein
VGDAPIPGAHAAGLLPDAPAGLEGEVRCYNQGHGRAAYGRRREDRLRTRRDSNETQMKHVFAGGSRKVTSLNAEVRERLDNMIEKQLAVFVGDANGADKAIQKYLSERHYPNVLVFCTAGEFRNNLGGWPIRAVKEPHSSRDFAFFTAEDAAMASEAEVGFMLWDGQSSGTIVNVARMVSIHIAAANVYYAEISTGS